MSWIKIGTYILIIIPTLFVGIVIGFYLIQDYMIFLGEKLPETHKFVFKSNFTEIDFKTTNGIRINALHFKTKDPKGLIYYHHGNAGNLQGWGNLGTNFLRLGYDVLFYDYRGYGKSTGKIRQQHQLHDDAEVILKEFLSDRKYNKVVYYGTSLGSGVAAKLAVNYPPAGLVLETPYYNFTDLVHYHYPYLPSNLLSKYKLRTDKYLKQVACPILLFHGTDDKIVPYESSLRLAKIREGIKLISIKNGVHNNLPEFDIYHRELKEFLDAM